MKTRKESRRSVRKKKTYKSFTRTAGILVCALLIITAFTSGKLPGGVSDSEASVSFKSDNNLPSGISGIVKGIETGNVRSINRIGTSAEKILVGQRESTANGSASNIDLRNSVSCSVENFNAACQSTSSAPFMMSDEDYTNLCRIVEAEAGTEDLKGRTLVANVILNRVAYDEFPDTVTDVVFEYRGGVAQFSPVYNGTIYTVQVTDTTVEAVNQALRGVDYSEGALFFIQKDASDKDAVKWFESDLKELFKYGVHDFYTYPDADTSKT